MVPNGKQEENNLKAELKSETTEQMISPYVMEQPCMYTQKNNINQTFANQPKRQPVRKLQSKMMVDQFIHRELFHICVPAERV